MRKDLIELDGSEGGGQILRSALSLSMTSGQPLRIRNIRGRRSRPGLLRQHLTAVRAAAEICAAEVEGAELGSRELAFRPGAIRAATTPSPSAPPAVARWYCKPCCRRCSRPTAKAG